MNLGGKAALVTGAANGLGHAISTYLADAGAIGIGFDKEAWGSRREDDEHSVEHDCAPRLSFAMLQPPPPCPRFATP